MKFLFKTSAYIKLINTKENQNNVLVVDTVNQIFDTKFKALELYITYDSKAFGTGIDEVQLLYQNTRRRKQFEKSYTPQTTKSNISPRSKGTLPENFSINQMKRLEEVNLNRMEKTNTDSYDKYKFHLSD